MVREMITYRVQEVLVEQLDKRFDGDAYMGAVQNPQFVVDFFANDREVLTQEEVEEFIDGFTATYDDREYTVTVEVAPERNYKYQFILSLEG